MSNSERFTQRVSTTVLPIKAVLSHIEPASVETTVESAVRALDKFLLNFIFQLTHCSLLRLIVRYGLDVQNFATRRLHACHHARAPSGGKWNCGREISGNFA